MIRSGSPDGRPRLSQRRTLRVKHAWWPDVALRRTAVFLTAFMSSSRVALVLLGTIYLGFVSLGLPDGTLGVAWPGVARELQLAIGLAGVVTTVITLLSA